MASRKVIVFGPTGAVGSSAARTAQELGAKVVLAMRDTQKSIPGLDIEKEKQGSFERVHADLTKPDTVRDAVSSTGAKYAFIYLTFGSPDSMLSTIEALKSSGIELVVFLSSFSVVGDLEKVEPQDLIAYAHAQVELNLEKVYGKGGYVALRPASFASNNLGFKAGIHEGEVKVFRPEISVDNIAPEDIGRVGGKILAEGRQDDSSFIYLCGPELSTQKETIQIIAETLGKNPKITESNKDEALRIQIEERKVPPPLANYLIGMMEKVKIGENQVFNFTIEPEWLTSVEKYTGKKGTTLAEWVKQNEHLWAA